MNVFEDLIVELKQENLLESTIIDGDQSPHIDADDTSFEEVSQREMHNEVNEHLVGEESNGFDLDPASADIAVEIETVDADDKVEIETPISVTSEVLAEPEKQSIPKKPRNGKEFYQKRAMNEVSSLQMVEHVLTGVEREFMKVVPRCFDDFQAKKALHIFLQVSENENTPEHQEAEFALIQETEAWCTALGNRDKTVAVSSLRQYCENSKPALSSQALLALARFYRNLPYTESVRSKFDFVITRLFSKSVAGEKRSLLFSREEALKHLKTLYQEWSSISLYEAADDDSQISLTALSFDDLAIEAENASSFDQLIKTDFFGRLRVFKESISEVFYAPTVTVAAIESNIRIGNAYVTLIALERRRMDADSIMLKYGDLQDDDVSDAAGRTLELVQLLKQEPEAPIARENFIDHDVDEAYEYAPDIEEPKSSEKAAKKPRIGSHIFSNLGEKAASMNRWFLAVSALIVLASIGIYVWANFVVSEGATTAGVKNVEVENPAFRDYVKTIRVSGDNYYAMLQPSWDVLPKEKRQEVLQKIYQAAVEVNCKQVTLLNKEGKSAGFASANRIDVVMP